MRKICVVRQKRFIHEHTNNRIFMQVEAEHGVSIWHQMYLKTLTWAFVRSQRRKHAL